MKIFGIVAAGISASLFLSVAARAAGELPVSSLKKQVAEAQEQVDRAQADFDQAKGRGESAMSSSDKAEWKRAEAKFDSLASADREPKKISAQLEVVEGIESRGMKSGREEVDSTRDGLVRAWTGSPTPKTD